MWLKGIIKQFTQREASPFIQFVKYGIAGVIATVVHTLVFSLCAIYLFPALTENDPACKYLGFPPAELSDTVRAWHATVNDVIAFLFSNFTAYIVNIYWVFEPGRHKKSVEMGMFFMVSGLSLGIAIALWWLFIGLFGMETSIAFGMKIVVAVMINYAARKFLIFKK